MTFFVNIWLNANKVVLFVWFIVKISFVKKKNCPDNLSRYTTVVEVVLINTVRLAFLELLITFMKIYKKKTQQKKRRILCKTSNHKDVMFT